MRFLSIFRENSLEDYQSGIDYYNKISVRLTERFDSDFKQKLDKIEENPFLFRIRYKNVRIAYLNQFPFGIHFIIEKQNIYILKIIHTKRFYK